MLADDLVAWFDAHARDLPWRRTTDPYAVLVSEVMLQQTQVARVVPRYLAWLERWPAEDDLAAAPLDEVLAAWVGLGYNRRAVRLREACAVVARDGWPADVEGLRALPGVGPYTAAAVAAFAYGQPVAAVDTNVARVGTRLDVVPQDVVDQAGSRGATAAAALMELGAVVCRARRADCDACPVAAGCPSRGAVVVAPRQAAGAGQRFEDTNRWARGRVVAALAAGEGLPRDVPQERLQRALDGLVADGLVVRSGTSVRLAR